MKQSYPIFVLFFTLLSTQLFAKSLDLIDPPTVTGPSSVCSGNQVTLTATGTGINWFDNAAGTGAPLATGNSFTTGVLTANTTFYAFATDTNGVVSTGTPKTITVNQIPSVSFSFDNDNSCSGTTIHFTSNPTNGSGPYTYAWDFGDSGTSTDANPSHSFTALGCGTQNFVVKLTVTSNGCSSSQIQQSIVVKQRPDVDFFDNNASPANQFNNCANAALNPVFSVSVGNDAASNCVTSYSVNWGDGSGTINNVNFPLNHTYTTLGAYNLTLTAHGQNGCQTTKTFVVKNVSNPSGGISSPGNTQNLCVPTPQLQFSISNWALNSPGTTYAVNFGDGTTIQNYTQEELVASIYYNSSNPSASSNYPIPHSYTITSCPNNQFIATLTVTNACGFTTGTIANISTIASPIPNFTNPANACVNTSVLFTNTSTMGFDTGCSRDTKYVWNFGDGSNPETVNYTSTTPNRSHTYTTAGTYAVTLSTQNGCGTTTVSHTICIEPALAAASFTLNNTTGCGTLTAQATNTTVTTGTCNVTYNWSVLYGTPNYCGTNPGSNYNYFANGSTSTSTNPSFNFPVPGTYTVKLIATNSCGSVQSTQTVTVKAPPTVSINSISNVCGGTSAVINPTASVTNCAGATPAPTYSWSFPGGSPATSTSENPGTITYSAAGTYTVTLSVTNECGTTSDTETFTVTPAVIANAGADQTVCSGAVTLNGTGSGGSGGTYQYSWSPTTGITAGATTPTPTVNPTATTTYTLTVTNGGCTATDQVTVYKNTVNAGAIGDNQTICSGSDPTLLTVATAATGQGTITYQWEVSTTNNTTGYTNVDGATSATYDPPPATVQTWYRRKVISTLNGISCEAYGNFIEIIINNVSAGTIAGDQTVCVGGNPVAFTVVSAATGSGTLTYQWQSSTDNSTFTNISGATAATYDAPSVNQTTYYKRIARSTFNPVLCTQESNVITVTVIALPTIITQPLSSQTICQGATPTTLQVAAEGGTGTFTYNWFVSNTNTTNGTIISGATEATYVPPTSNTGTKYYYCVVSQSAPGCSVTSNVAQVQVIAAPTINTQPASSTVCVNGTPTQLSVIYTNGTGTPTYQWYTNTINSNIGGTAIPTATGSSYQPQATAEGISYYYVIITFPSGGCSSITSSVASVTVNPLPQIITQPTPEQSICVGGIITPLSVAGNSTSGTASYQWYSNTTNTNTGGTVISGATQATYSPAAYNTAGTRYYYAIITYGNSGCGTVTSNVATVNVVADPVITAQPTTTQSLCQSPAANEISVTATGGVGTLSYQWYSNTTNSTTSGTIIANATAAAYTPTANTVGTIYYYCIITTPASGCSVTSNTAQVIVISAPYVSTQPQPQTLCFGATPASLTAAYTNGTGTPTYQWYSNTTNSNNGGTVISGATTATYQPSSAAAGTVYYYVQITFATGGCSVITSNAVAVTINPLPSVTSIAPQTICSGETLSVTPQDGNGNSIPTGTQYTWTVPANNNINGESNQTILQNNISQTLTNITNAPITLTYTVTPVANGCNGATFQVQVTVNPKPSITAQAITVCNDTAFTLTPTNGSGTIVPTGTTYTWSAPTGTGLTGGEAGTDATNIIGTLSNTTNTAQTATYIVTPKWTSGSETCTGEPFTLAVTINPEPVVDNIATIVCSGATFTLTPVNGTNGNVPANTQYTWTAPAAISGISGLAAGNNQTSISGNLTNTTNAPIVVTYIVTPKAGTCEGDTFEAAVTVNPVPTVNSIPPQTVCNGSQTLGITFSGSVDGTTYNWLNNSPSIGLAASGTGNIAAFTPVNTGTTAVTASITVTPVANGCSGTPQTFTITVNPAPTVNFSQTNQTICSNTATAVVNLSSATPNTSIAWTANVPAGITGATASGTTTIPAQILVNNTSTPLTVTYTATATTSDTSACPGAASVYTITVTPVPFADGAQQATTCSGTALNFIPANTENTNMPAGVTFTWAAPTGNGFMGGSAQSTPQTSLNPTLVNTTNTPITATYTVTPHFGGCNGIPFTVQVTVNPTATIPNATLTQCSGTSFTFDPATVATIFPAGTVFNWNAPIGNISGGASGSAQATVTGTLANTTASAQAAMYTITPVSPQGNCNGTPFTLTVTVNPQFAVTATVSNYNGFQISSAGANDAFINLATTGGTGTYTCNWTGPNGFTATTQNITNLGPGTYTVIVGDGLCQNITQTFIITEPMPLLIAEVATSHVNVNCFGQSTGAIEVEITQESIAPYDYAILLPNGAVVENVLNLAATNYVFDNLPAGTYNIRVTDANGTIKYINGVQITQPATGLAITNATVSNFNGFSISCNGANNGAIDLTVSGGYPGYTYSWTGPNGFTATTEDIASLVPGTYAVTIHDTTNACPVTQNFTITQPQPVAFTGTVPSSNGYQISCFGGNNGSINITPTGGTSVYSYAWTGPGSFTASTQNLANLAVGTYTLTLTDSNGCSPASQSFTLTQPQALAVTESHVNVLCFGAATGSIDITVTGGIPDGTGAYTYAWTGPNGFTSASEDLANIAAGVYNLVATDLNGCTIAQSVTITQQPEIIITPTTTPITCYGANNASISLAISGGDAPYTVTWSNLATGTYQDNLAAGTYTITVTDESNCVKVITVVIPEAPIFTVTPVFNHISCHGANDGSIALNLVGGIAPLTLVWSDGSNQGTTRNNLGPGIYTATITDGTPCQIVRTFTIVEPAALTVGANITHALDCNDAQSGAINLVVAGGTLPYTFNWSNGDTTEDLTGLTSGTYSVTVTDANGCTATGTYNITRPEPMALNVTSNLNTNCNTHSVIQTNIAQASGGVPPFQYTWSAGTVSGNFGQFMNTNQNGAIIVTATDSQGCTATTTFEVDTQQLGEADFTAGSYAFTTYQYYSIFDPVTFENLSTGDYIEVGWNFGDGSTSNELNPSHTYVREGTYQVTLHVVYPYGCSDTYTMTIIVTKGYEVMVPNAFTPNGDYRNETFNALHRGLKSIELNVFDTWGELVYSEKGETLRGWNGFVKNNPAENGNFYYRIKAETFYGHIVEFDGPFVLIK